MCRSTIENRGIDETLFEAICQVNEDQPCYQTMGIRLTYVAPGIAGMEKDPDLRFSTYGGRAQGGVLATLADAVMGTAIFTTGYIYRTIEMCLNYIAPAFEDDVTTAEGRIIHLGKTLAMVEGSLFNKEGKLIAKAKGTFIKDAKSPDVQEIIELYKKGLL